MKTNRHKRSGSGHPITADSEKNPLPDDASSSGNASLSDAKISYVSFLKSNWHILVLLALMIFGFSIRAYHIDYPSIGYHNMKENIYLMYAYHMYEGDGPFKLSVFYLAGKENNYQKDMLPLLAWSIALSWKIFGINLFVPRLMIILCSIANIALIYWLAYSLTKKKELGLISAALMTVMPISVFFGRNIQPDIPGVTFMLLYSIFLYRWIQSDSRKDFLWFVLFLGISFNLKLTNLVGLIPFMFILPYGRAIRNIRRYIPEAVITVLVLSTAYIWKYSQEFIMPDSSTVYDSIFSELFDGFGASYWAQYKPVIYSFLIDNYSWWFVWLAFFGAVLAAVKYRTVLGKYIIGSLIGLFIYFCVVPGYMVRHNYYQAPFLPLVVFLSAYFIYVAGIFIGDIINGIVSHKGLRPFVRYASVFLFALLVVSLAWHGSGLPVLKKMGSLKSSINRQFDTQFIGCDAAGEYINKNSLPSEKVFMGTDPSGQTISMLWAAKRYGAWMPQNLTEFRKLENEKDFSWMFLYRDAIAFLQSDHRYKDSIWPYIEGNYHIEQIGAIASQGGLQPYYFILKRGGSFNMSDFSNVPAAKAKDYEFTYGKISFYTVGRS